MKEIKNIKQFIFKTDAICIFCIEVLTLLFLCFITQNNFNIFSTDDNIMQWEPVIQKGFDYLFETGSFAYIDFYQYGKMNILDVGFYGFTNPLMFLSYIISRFIFSVKIHVLPIYITLSILTGNIFFYKTLKLLKIKPIFAFLATLSYVTMPFFYVYAFYYFSFNNYFFIPLFVFIFLKSYNSKLKYVAPGICLGFACFLGHAQYWVYYYMVYTIMEFVLLFLEKNWKRLYVYFSNLGTSILICLPNIILLAQAGIRRAQNHMDFEHFDFFEFPVCFITVFQNFLNPLISYQVMRYHDITINYNQNHVYLGPVILLFFSFIYYLIYHMLDNKAYTACRKLTFKIVLVISIILSLILRIHDEKTIPVFIVILGLFVFKKLYFSKKKFLALDALVVTALFFIPEAFLVSFIYLFYNSECFHKNKFLKLIKYPFAFFVIVLFFALFAWGKDSFIAPILKQIPMLSQFRYLYKCWFLALVFINLCAATLYILSKTKKQKSLISIVLLLNICMNLYHIGNIYIIANNHPFINNTNYSYNVTGTNKYLTDMQIESDNYALDLKNYRFASVGHEYKEAENLIGNIKKQYNASTHMLELKSKNFATLAEIFAIGGYDDGFSSAYVNMVNMMNKNLTEQFHFSQYQFPIDFKKKVQLKIKKSEYFDYRFHNLIWTTSFINLLNSKQKRIDAFSKQINQEAVKYWIFLTIDKKHIKNFEKLIKRTQYTIERVIKPNNDIFIVELGNITGLVSSNLRKRIPLTSKIAMLKIDKEIGETQFRFSFIYDPHYKATFCNDEGMCSDLIIEPDDMQYTIITMDPSLIDKKGTITLIYKNILCTTTMWFAFLSWILMLGLLFKLKEKNHER